MYAILTFGFIKFIIEHKVTNKLYPTFILNLKDVYGLKKYFKSKQQCQWVENMCYYVYMLKNVFNCCIYHYNKIFLSKRINVYSNGFIIQLIL